MSINIALCFVKRRVGARRAGATKASRVSSGVMPISTLVWTFGKWRGSARSRMPSCAPRASQGRFEQPVAGFFSNRPAGRLVVRPRAGTLPETFPGCQPKGGNRPPHHPKPRGRLNFRTHTKIRSLSDFWNGVRASRFPGRRHQVGGPLAYSVRCQAGRLIYISGLENHQNWRLWSLSNPLGVQSETKAPSMPPWKRSMKGSKPHATS